MWLFTSVMADFNRFCRGVQVSGGRKASGFRISDVVNYRQ